MNYATRRLEIGDPPFSWWQAIDKGRLVGSGETEGAAIVDADRAAFRKAHAWDDRIVRVTVMRGHRWLNGRLVEV